jgi:hypothetical protein
MPKKISITFVVVTALFIMVLGNLGQTPVAQGPDYQERKLAVDLVRVINTAQMTYRDRSSGIFADWADLSRSQGFVQAIDRFSHGDPKLKDVRLEDSSEILPGWRLRLTIASDKKSYMMLLAKTSGKCQVCCC